MSKYCFFFLLTFICSGLASTPAFSHAGINHGDNCLIKISGEKLRLGGFQSAEKIGGTKHYCHLFPATGPVIFTFEPDAIHYLDKQLDLKLLAANSYWDILFNYEHSFRKVLLQLTDKTTIEYNFSRPGIYALEVTLRKKNQLPDQLEPSQNNTQKFLFLVGFPIIKILVFIAFGFLLLIGFVLIKQLQAKTVPKS